MSFTKANELLKKLNKPQSPSTYLKIKQRNIREGEYFYEYIYARIMGPSDSYSFPLRVEIINATKSMPPLVNLAYPHPNVEICSEEEYLLSLVMES